MSSSSVAKHPLLSSDLLAELLGIVADTARSWRRFGSHQWLGFPSHMPCNDRFAGHYVFGSEEFRRICADPDQEVRDAVCAKLDWYVGHPHSEPVATRGAVPSTAVFPS